uniref:Transmembrane domain containing protein n=1 Tax=Marseillevirus sp. TaxID=2809551 RepID=A0AA96ERB3_9VIRU|nr:transmembrane domain containing protein [Marseillevirus sp.]
MSRLAVSLFAFGIFLSSLFALLMSHFTDEKPNSLELLFSVLLFMIVYTALAGTGYAFSKWRAHSTS